MLNYIKDIRKKIGTELLLIPGARVLVENKNGEFLFIKRTDNGNWGIPAGGLEKNETIRECAVREVKEEAGIELLSIQVIGISSHPQKELMIYPNGDHTQYCAIEFYSNHYKGNPNADGKESSEAVFLSIDYKNSLPLNEQATFESLRHFRETGQIRLS